MDKVRFETEEGFKTYENAIHETRRNPDITDNTIFRSKPSPFIYAGPIVHSRSLETLEILEKGIVVVSEGKIVHVDRGGDLDELKRKYSVEDENVFVLEEQQFIVPGFIDTHIHAPQYPNAGLGFDKTLLDWLNTYTFPLETKFNDEKFARLVYEKVVRRTVANGTTTASYFATIHAEASLILAETAQKIGQRAFVGKVNMTRNSPADYCETFEESVSNTELFVRKVLDLKCPLITPIITPRFAISCDAKLMKKLADIALEREIPIQTHISENVDEVKFTMELYPEHRNYTDVYDAAGLITEKTILAHGIYLSPEEIKTIKERGATVSHCANSNCMLQSGLCPVRKLLSSGVKVALGTDCSGGYSCSMLDAIRQAIQTSVQCQLYGNGEKLSLAEAFYLATLGGAQALGASNVTGNFTIGKDFDAIVVNMKNNAAIDLLLDYDVRELFEKFIYLGDDRLIDKVYVAGREIKNSASR